jgi:hypothetical protein
MRHILAFVVVVGSACSKDPVAAPAPQPKPAPADARPAVSAPIPDAQPPIPTLPPFGKTATSDPAKAMERARQGLRNSVLGEGDGIAEAIEGVTADPGLPYARYAIACAVHDEAFATAQLKLLADAKGCDDCTEMLQNVLIDSECTWAPAHKALAAASKPSAQRAAVAAILKALSAKDRSGAKPYFTGAHVTSVFECSNCSDNTNDTHASGTGAKVLAEISKILAKDDGFGVPIITGDRLLRTGDCYSVDRLLLHHNHVFFDKVCFAHGTTTVSSIVFIDG